MEQYNCGKAEQADRKTVTQWNSTVVVWYGPIAAERIMGIEAQWNGGTMERWHSGTKAKRNDGRVDLVAQ